MTFTPEIHGIYKLCVKYKNVYITNCPYYFHVLKELNKVALNELIGINDVTNSNSHNNIRNNSSSNSIISPTGVTIIDESVYDTSQVFLKNEPVEAGDNNSTLNSTKSNENLSHHNSNNLLSGGGDASVGSRNQWTNSMLNSKGRGKLIKQMITSNSRLNDFNLHTNKPLANSSVVIQSSRNNNNTVPSQKRKSPLINYFDENENVDNDVEMGEISNKLKKVVVDESNNQYYKYNTSERHEIRSNFDYSRLSGADNNASTSLCFLSEHLNRIASIKFGDLPTLKLKFQRKYTHNMQFPIGVTASTTNNWVIVADNGNHSVKIFERTSGEFIRELQGDLKDGSTPFKRPSALLLNSNDNELYVKDDLQIQVFDIDDNFKFKRRFGANLLRRPYGN